MLQGIAFFFSSFPEKHRQGTKYKFSQKKKNYYFSFISFMLICKVETPLNSLISIE